MKQGIVMTQQTMRAREEVDITGCVRCAFYSDVGLFQLCKHERSTYAVNSTAASEFHTIQHMRGSEGQCGLERRLMK